MRKQRFVGTALKIAWLPENFALGGKMLPDGDDNVPAAVFDGNWRENANFPQFFECQWLIGAELRESVGGGEGLRLYAKIGGEIGAQRLQVGK